MKNREFAAWEFVSEDKKEALLSVVTLSTHGNAPVNYVRLKGLDENRVYFEKYSQKEYLGSALMYAGLPLPIITGEYQSLQMHFVCKA